jgi:hypothetical protein
MTRFAALGLVGFNANLLQATSFRRNLTKYNAEARLYATREEALTALGEMRDAPPPKTSVKRG